MKFLSLLIIVATTLSLYSGSYNKTVISSSINGEEWKENSSISPLKGEKISLKVKPIVHADVRWYQIYPELSQPYKNANHPWEKNPYKWAGFAKIEYHKRELTQFRGKWQIDITAKDLALPEKMKFYHNDMGTFRFQVVVTKGTKIYRSEGVEENRERGISPKVFRISIRDGIGYIGYLTSFFNVPGLFGSIPYQSANYIGADCADILIAAHGKWKKKDVKTDYNVAMLVKRFKKVAKFRLIKGVPDKKIIWGKDIRQGDFIAVRYDNRKQFQHIGALYKDKNQNGILDKNDYVIHAGPYPLVISHLKRGAFDGEVIILRP